MLSSNGNQASALCQPHFLFSNYFLQLSKSNVFKIWTIIKPQNHHIINAPQMVWRSVSCKLAFIARWDHNNRGHWWNALNLAALHWYSCCWLLLMLYWLSSAMVSPFLPAFSEVVRVAWREICLCFQFSPSFAFLVAVYWVLLFSPSTAVSCLRFIYMRFQVLTSEYEWPFCIPHSKSNRFRFVSHVFMS